MMVNGVSVPRRTWLNPAAQHGGRPAGLRASNRSGSDGDSTYVHRAFARAAPLRGADERGSGTRPYA